MHFFFSAPQAHLKSEINYNWEKHMHSGSNKPTLKKKGGSKATKFFSWLGFRDRKLKWVEHKVRKNPSLIFKLSSPVTIPTPSKI